MIRSLSTIVLALFCLGTLAWAQDAPLTNYEVESGKITYVTSARFLKDARLNSTFLFDSHGERQRMETTVEGELFDDTYPGMDVSIGADGKQYIYSTETDEGEMREDPEATIGVPMQGDDSEKIQVKFRVTPRLTLTLNDQPIYSAEITDEMLEGSGIKKESREIAGVMADIFAIHDTAQGMVLTGAFWKGIPLELMVQRYITDDETGETTLETEIHVLAQTFDPKAVVPENAFMPPSDKTYWMEK